MVEAHVAEDRLTLFMVGRLSRQFADVIIELIPRWYRALEHPCGRRGALLLFYG